MGIKTQVGLLVGLFLVSAATPALADKLCLQSTVNKRTLKVTNKSVVAATCPNGYTELADTSKFQGPAGIVNLAACTRKGGTCNHPAGINTCTVDCDNGEFVLQYTTVASSDFCTPNPQYGTSSYSLTYSNGLGAGVKFFTSSNCSYQATVNALCCPIS